MWLYDSTPRGRLCRLNRTLTRTTKMTDQNQNPDPQTVEEEKELAFQTLEGEWEFNPFTVQVQMEYGHKKYPVWVQARNRSDLDSLESRDPSLYKTEFFVAVRNNAFGIKPGVVLRVIHGGTSAPEIDRNWIKAVAWADPNQDHNEILPELEVIPALANEVKGEMRANDGKLASRDFNQDYFG